MTDGEDEERRRHATTQPAPKWPSAHVGANQHILVVDDEPGVRRVVERTLREAGFEVTSASNGAEALDRLRANDPPIAAIVLDVGMPSMNGYQFRVRQLADPAIAHVPVVVLSAETMHATIDHLKAAATVPKPFVRGELVEAVLHALSPEEPR
jgi:CheY-like chemotaxis protein